MRRALERLRRELTALDAEAARDRAADPQPDRAPLIVTLVAGLCLVFMEYTRERPLLRALYAAMPALQVPRFAALAELATWVLVRIIGFFVLPALAVRLLLHERLRDHGLAVAGLGPHLRTYLGVFALVLPCIVVASLQPAFTAYYPFYRFAGASWLDLGVWELLYGLQFVALEFFFRGFWLTGCRRSFGTHAVLVSAVPYCMIHFTKPVLEVIAALPAGIVLGLLALRARSIWGGALVHVAVAWTMDLLALLRTTGLPTRLLP